MWYLGEQGIEVVARNLTVPGGEIDLLAVDRGTRVAFEVRTRVGGADPVDAAGAGKRSHAAALARRAGAFRLDVIGLRLDATGFDLHWVPGAG
ncbi:MAG: YraN family protein [Actinobacteria bacterium]|nr:YraN family protein [Actinomycetota bacterium]MCI0678812.1 YraN family protein [Actinomycetota bacterium]